MKDKTREKSKERPRERDKARDGEPGSRRFASIKRIVRETRSELKKVVWPTREEARNLTFIVTVVSIVVGLFMGGVDYLFKRLFEIFLGG